MIDLEPGQLEEIKGILSQHVPGCEVRVFGSRVNGRAEQFSDLDLALVCAAKLDHHTLERVKDAFAESDLPIQIDVHDWHSLSDSFKKIIEAGYENI
ncbi:MAG: nucleotidyltransferase domain-containing protein [Spirochaetia bacterium]